MSVEIRFPIPLKHGYHTFIVEEGRKDGSYTRRYSCAATGGYYRGFWDVGQIASFSIKDPSDRVEPIGEYTIGDDGDLL